MILKRFYLKALLLSTERKRRKRSLTTSIVACNEGVARRTFLEDIWKKGYTVVDLEVVKVKEHKE